jgi:hypothetical protein
MKPPGSVAWKLSASCRPGFQLFVGGPADADVQLGA